MAKQRGQSVSVTGGCLCGAVRYEIRGPLRNIINCHCSNAGGFTATPGPTLPSSASIWSCSRRTVEVVSLRDR